MRSLFLSLCFAFASMVFYNYASYGADFSYDIDRFTQVGGASGSATFVDEFNDGAEPPSGPSGASTYSVAFPLSSNRETGGFLNLNSDDADSWFPGVGEKFVGAAMIDNTFYFNAGSGGSVEGKYRFNGGINTNSGFDINIMTLSSSSIGPGQPPAIVEAVWFGVDKSPSGSIFAYLESELNGIENDISELNITNLLNGVTDLTLRLEISTSNVVSASLDFGSDGSFDVVMPGSYTLAFIPGRNYTGTFGAGEGSCLYCDLMVNQDGSVDLFIENVCGEAVPTEVKMWAELSGQIISILNVGSDGSTVLPDGLDTSARVVQPQPGALPDDLILGLRFLDPVTGEEQCVAKVETVFFENFNDGVADNHVNDGSGRWSASSGSYVMNGTGAGSNNLTWSYYNQDFTDFAYSAFVNKVSGNANDFMGISFRGTNMFTANKNGYGFQIKTTGEYRLVNAQPAVPVTELIPWTSSPAINTGFNVWNELKVVVQGAEIELYINGTFVNSVINTTHTSGKPYLAAFDGTATTDVRFENVQLTRILE